jgi:hypothetical protein
MDDNSNLGSKFSSIVVEYLQKDAIVKSDDKVIKRIIKRKRKVEMDCQTVKNRSDS